MSRIVDFHSHILPGIDDGSRSVEESLTMLRMSAEQGVRHVVATPHFYANHDHIAAFLERRAEAEEILREAMSGQEGMPRLTVGAEVYFFRGISESDVLQQLTIGKTPYSLIEMPAAPWTDSMYRELAQIYHKQGIMPIVAHVDRYISGFRTFGIPEKLQEMPVLVQANASFFCGSRAMRAMRMLRKEQIHLLGSDCHNLTDRKPNLGLALEKIAKSGGEQLLEHMADLQCNIFDE